MRYWCWSVSAAMRAPPGSRRLRSMALWPTGTITQRWCWSRTAGGGTDRRNVRMKNEEFESLVSRLEAEAKRNPASYGTRVLLMALLGNAYLGVMLLVIVVLFLIAAVSVVWLKAAGVKIAIVMAVFLWMVLKALWVRLAPPQGTEITAREAPALFAMIEELR